MESVTEMEQIGGSIAIGFPGQGVHEPKKLRRLLSEHPTVINLFIEAEDTLKIPILNLVVGESVNELTSRQNQVRLYLGSTALWSVAEESGIIPEKKKRIFFGASAGEYGALMAAGAYDFSTGLKLIDARGDEMHKASIINPGKMLVASGIPFKEGEEIAKNFPGAYAVNDNPGIQTVFSGTEEAISALGEYLSSLSDIRIHLPDIQEAAHSIHMAPAVEGVKNALNKARMKKPSHDFISNRARQLKSTRGIKSHLSAQLTRGVLLTESARLLRDKYGVETFVDVGPGKVLYTQFKRQFRKTVKLISVVDELLPESN